MNALSTLTAAPAPDPAEDRDSALAERLDAEMTAMNERHLRHLAELAEIGMGLARAVKQRQAQVEAAEDPAAAAELGELGLSFNRITRAVRLSLTLEARVRREDRTRRLGLEAEQAAAAAARTEARARAEDKRRRAKLDVFGQLVEETVRADILRRRGMTVAEYDAGDVELEEEEEEAIEDAFVAAERMLARRKAYQGFEQRPRSAVLIDLCRDLNLGPPDWSLWADEDWAIEEAEGVEGSPFSKPLPLCGEGVGDGAAASAPGEVTADNPDLPHFTPTPSPSPQGGGDSTGPP